METEIDRSQAERTVDALRSRTTGISRWNRDMEVEKCQCNLSTKWRLGATTQYAGLWRNSRRDHWL